jgi:predicted secreted Zn-dependent protease
MAIDEFKAISMIACGAKGRRLVTKMTLRIVLLGCALVIAACTAVGDRTQLSVGYYSIEGGSFAELDQQIALHGPSVSGVGRALAATNVRMIPNFQFGWQGKNCVVRQARVSVKAHVTLPKLRGERKVDPALSNAWSDMEQYARMHEAIHVSIADSYALKVEEAVMNLPPANSCEELRANAVILFRRLMAEHERDQLQFDEEEKERIAALVNETRLKYAKRPQ